MLSGFMHHPDLLPAIIISAIFVLTFACAEILRIYAHFKVEATRKFVHLAAGVVSLTFAYIFKSHWTLLILCAIFVIIMQVTKKMQLLPSIHKVGRTSHGSIYHPIAMYVSFYFASILKKPEFYFVSVLVLSVSDSLAALIGSTYGIKLYRVQDENKSIEGSTIFFFSTFFLIHLSLLLLTDIGRLESVLVAMVIAILVTFVEAIALEGSDNLFIPWGTFFILYKLDGMSAIGLFKQLFKFIASFFLILIASYPSQKFGISGIIGLALISYGCWSMMGFDWFVPAIIGTACLSYTDIFLGPAKDESAQKRVRNVFYSVVVSMVWLIIASFFYHQRQLFTVPFIISFLSQMSLLWKRRRIELQGEGKEISTIQGVNLPARAAVLTALFLPPFFFSDNVLSPLFSLATCFVGIMMSDGFYFSMTLFNKSWNEITDLRARMWANLLSTFSIFLMNYFWYTI
ncbi:MAG: hypothetical protein HQM10_18260 [Candidatus Riflebacteria bacterium]|nr:hypothetical protein [Candidatus Riflebacteria bacterium]